MSEQSKSQAAKFRDLARELECDEDEAAFDERLRRLARGVKVEQKSVPETPKKR